MEIESVIKFVKEEIPEIRSMDRWEAINSLWVIIDGRGIDDLNDLDADERRTLKLETLDAIGFAEWENIPIDTIAHTLGAVDGGEVTNGRPSGVRTLLVSDAEAALTAELEHASGTFEGERAELQESLPPVLFEALCLRVSADMKPKWCDGFDEETLDALCYRAAVRRDWNAHLETAKESEISG